MRNEWTHHRTPNTIDDYLVGGVDANFIHLLLLLLANIDEYKFNNFRTNHV